MVKQIIWSLRALDDRKEIFSYWNSRNKSTAYSKKLNQLFKEAIKLISHFPQIGRPTEIKNIRIKLVRDYLIVYEETSTQIHILTLWDGRRDEEKFKKFIH